MSAPSRLFSLDQSPNFRFEAKIPSAGADPQSLFLYGVRKSRSELTELFVTAQSQKTPDAELVAQVIVDWDNVDIDFSPEALADLCDRFPAAPWAILTAWRDALFEGRRGN